MGKSFGPDMRPTNTSVISCVKSTSSPFQWNGSVPRRPVCSDCVRRAPTALPLASQPKVHTRPSSSPSVWHEAQATKPPELA